MAVIIQTSLAAEQDPLHQGQNIYSRWSHGPPSDPGFFPIAVWLQNPTHAARYQAAGINVYVGLWRGPTPDQLSLLEKAGMRVICRQNQAALTNKENRLIIGWMHNDEPDNAQSLGQGKGYGPPVLPERIQKDYNASYGGKDQAVAVMMKRSAGTIYLFAANLRNQPAEPSFRIREVPENARGAVMGESRQIALVKGEFRDRFTPYAVHLYHVTPP